MFSKLEEVEKKFDELEQKLLDPKIMSNQEEFKKVSKERSSLTDLIECYRLYKKLTQEYADNKSLLEDPEMKDLAKEELPRLEKEVSETEERLKILLIPKDPNDERNVIVEIRAGAGGDEAAIFAGDLFRLYQKFADEQRWRVELMSANPIGIGGFKEIIFTMEGDKVYSKMKYEGGVHRVQRVPKTEGSGRIHTSTITVAVMPEADDVEVNINPADLKVETFRAGGPGGQSVNTTDSAVRITHIPTGVVVSCQDEKSQHKNKDKAFKILRARIYEAERLRQEKELSDQRKLMVGTGDRSERIRTYNFPQGRLTDHRIGLTLYQLPEIMEGKLLPVVDALVAYFNALALKGESAQAPRPTTDDDE